MAHDESAFEQALRGIQRRLQLTGSPLLIARRAGAAVGFGLFAPHHSTVELYILAVDPGAWGSGVAGPLLRRVVAEARAVGATTVELWVIDDDHRAIGVYVRSGWVRTERLQHDSATSRVERLLVNHLY